MRDWKWGLCLGIFLLFIFSSVEARCDLYFENENVSNGMPNQKNGMTTQIQKNYVTDSASRVEMGDGKIMIFDYKSMIMYTMDPQTRSYTRIDMNEFMMPANMSAQDKETMGKMMGSMMGINVTPTNETKVIAGYNCRKYTVTVAMVEGEYWVSQDVKGYKELKAIGAKLGSMLEKNPMIRQMNVAGMVEKLDGFPVQTINHIMGGKIVSTLKRVEQAPLDPQLFRVPSDYSQKTK